MAHPPDEREPDTAEPAETGGADLSGAEPLVGEDWRPSGVQDAGAAELAARIEAAPPTVVARGALEGRCGLEDRELWALGVRLERPGALAVGEGVALRLVVVLAALAIVPLLLFAASGAVLVAEGEGERAPLVAVLIVVLLLVAAAARRLMSGAGGRLRERRLARRRVQAAPVPPLLDPHGRLTVAVLDGPGVLRVLLLWVRGAAEDPDRLEVRTLAERRVPRDEPLAAEDAVAALSEVAMLGGRLREAPGGVDARLLPPAATRPLAPPAARTS